MASRPRALPARPCVFTLACLSDPASSAPPPQECGGLSVLLPPGLSSRDSTAIWKWRGGGGCLGDLLLFTVGIHLGDLLLFTVIQCE